MNATGTEARVCQDIAERQARGIAKYGTTVEGNPLGMVQWVRHAYEECLDQAVYLRRLLEVMEGVERSPEDLQKIKKAAMRSALDRFASSMDGESTTLEDGSTLTASGPANRDNSYMGSAGGPAQFSAAYFGDAGA